MNIFKTITELKSYIKVLKSQGLTVGFVPTMGALHQGHISLIKKADEENDIVVCSIFVNPVQFNNKEDLIKYPRTVDADIRILQENNCDILFLPDSDEMYPEPDTTVFDFGHLDKILEGMFRPGHFNGVAIVVKKLFEIVEPDKAYFGVKDYQQLAIIKALVKNHGIPVVIVPCLSVREDDGLALSSRNVRLGEHERSIAPEIYRILSDAKARAVKSNPSEIKEWVMSEFRRYPEFQVEYFEIVDPDTLLNIDIPEPEQKYIAVVAVFLGEIRLIDNIDYFF